MAHCKMRGKGGMSKHFFHQLTCQNQEFLIPCLIRINTKRENTLLRLFAARCIACYSRVWVLWYFDWRSQSRWVTLSKMKDVWKVISFSFETPQLDAALRKACVFLSSHSSTDCSTKYKTALGFSLACSILKLFISTLDSQVFAASLSPWWISWAVEGSPGRTQLHAELSCLCCRGAATRGYLWCLCAGCSYTQFWCTSLITLLWTGVAIQKQNLLASRLRFPIQLEAKTKELEKWSFHP